MLTYTECLEMSGLSREEIAAIAEHEHVDPLCAAAIGSYLLSHDGEQKIRKMILDDIEAASARGDVEHEKELLRVLAHFVTEHPEYRQGI